MELPDVPRIVHELNARAREAGPRFPELLAGLDRDALHALGAGYLESTRVQRKTGAPFFIDKNPNNWLYLGLIQLMLPNARIIDARRHPLACGFSCSSRTLRVVRALPTTSKISAATTATTSSRWRPSSAPLRTGTTQAR